MVVNSVIQKVDSKRLKTAVEGLVFGAYTVTVTARSEEKVSGYVVNGDGKEYGVVLTSEMTTCSCPDSMYRHRVCKHQVILALHVVRHPQEQPQEGERRPNLRLARVREGFCG